MPKHPIAEIIAAVFWNFWYDTSLTGTLLVLRFMIDMNETVPYTRNINTVIALVKPSTIASVFNIIDGTHINAITIKEVIDININPPNDSHLPLLIFLNH